jgi:glucose-1-phosphate cytidylyltransferase
VNIGFFIFSSKIFQYINIDSILEEDVLKLLANLNEISAFKHDGFWQPMDTYRESLILNKLWDQNLAPWKNW